MIKMLQWISGKGPDRITAPLLRKKKSENKSKRLCYVPEQSSVLAQLSPRISVVCKYQSAPHLGGGSYPFLQHGGESQALNLFTCTGSSSACHTHFGRCACKF